MNNGTRAIDFNELPPHSIEAEQCLLASMMLAPDLIRHGMQLFNRTAFFQVDHQLIFDALVGLFKNGQPVDAVILADELSRRQTLDDIGGPAYIGTIINKVPTASHGEQYAGIVLEKSRLRTALQIAHDAIRDVYRGSNDDDPAAQILSSMASRASAAALVGTVETHVVLGSVIRQIFQARRDGKRNRIFTGLTQLDDITGGLPIGGMTIVASPPGMGKSQFCKQLAANVSGFCQLPVGIVAAEESVEKIACNYIAGRSGIANKRVTSNTNLTNQEWEAIWNAVDAMEQAPVPIVIDDANRRLSRIEYSVRRMVRNHNCKMIVVDHLHLIDGETDANRVQEVTKISGALKALFKELGVAGVVACQVNRSGDLLEEPELRQLRDSGSLEADGDLIIQFRRRDYVEWKKQGDAFIPDRKLEAFINKNKDGPVGLVNLYFDGNGQRVTDWNNGAGVEAECPF